MSKQNDPLSSLTHLIGVGLSIAALVLMIVFAALKGTVWHVVSFTIFGSALILLYLASTLYHFFDMRGKPRQVFMRIDHSMIYVLIAATYTPICLVPLRGALGWTVFGVVWGIALFGILWKSFFTFEKKSAKIISTLLYLLMGWLIVVAVAPLFAVFTFWAFFWLVLGGICYSLGTIFFVLDFFYPRKTRWFGMHDIFHLFVIAGSFSHFWLMLRFVLYM